MALNFWPRHELAPAVVRTKRIGLGSLCLCVDTKPSDLQIDSLLRVIEVSDSKAALLKPRVDKLGPSRYFDPLAARSSC